MAGSLTSGLSILEVYDTFQDPVIKVEENADQDVNIEKKSCPYLPNEAIQKWFTDVNMKLFRVTQQDNEKLVDDLMETYKGSLQKAVIQSHLYKRFFGQKILSHIGYFYLYYKEINSVTDTKYFIHMEDILAYYCSLQLELITHRKPEIEERKKTNEDHVKRLCKESCRVLGIYLHHKLVHIIHVLLKLNYNPQNPYSQSMMRRIFYHFLIDLPFEPFSDENFCRYYLAFEKYKVVALDHEKEKLQKFMFYKFGKTENYLRESPLLKMLLSPPVASVPDLVTHILDFNKNATKRYFEYISKSRDNETDKSVLNYDAGYDVNRFPRKCNLRNTTIIPDSEIVDVDSDSEVEFMGESTMVEGPIVVSDEDVILIDDQKSNNKTKKKKKKKKDENVISLDSDDSESDTMDSPLDKILSTGKPSTVTTKSVTVKTNLAAPSCSRDIPVPVISTRVIAAVSPSAPMEICLMDIPISTNAKVKPIESSDVSSDMPDRTGTPSSLLSCRLEPLQLQDSSEVSKEIHPTPAQSFLSSSSEQNKDCNPDKQNSSLLFLSNSPTSLIKLPLDHQLLLDTANLVGNDQTSNINLNEKEKTYNVTAVSIRERNLKLPILGKQSDAILLASMIKQEINSDGSKTCDLQPSEQNMLTEISHPKASTEIYPQHTAASLPHNLSSTALEGIRSNNDIILTASVSPEENKKNDMEDIIMTDSIIQSKQVEDSFLLNSEPLPNASILSTDILSSITENDKNKDVMEDTFAQRKTQLQLNVKTREKLFSDSEPNSESQKELNLYSPTKTQISNLLQNTAPLAFHVSERQSKHIDLCNPSVTVEDILVGHSCKDSEDSLFTCKSGNNSYTDKYLCLHSPNSCSHDTNSSDVMNESRNSTMLLDASHSIPIKDNVCKNSEQIIALAKSEKVSSKASQTNSEGSVEYIREKSLSENELPAVGEIRRDLSPTAEAITSHSFTMKPTESELSLDKLAGNKFDYSEIIATCAKNEMALRSTSPSVQLAPYQMQILLQATHRPLGNVAYFKRSTVETYTRTFENKAGSSNLVQALPSTRVLSSQMSQNAPPISPNAIEDAVNVTAIPDTEDNPVLTRECEEANTLTGLLIEDETVANDLTSKSINPATSSEYKAISEQLLHLGIVRPAGSRTDEHRIEFEDSEYRTISSQTSNLNNLPVDDVETDDQLNDDVRVAETMDIDTGQLDVYKSLGISENINSPHAQNCELKNGATNKKDAHKTLFTSAPMKLPCVSGLTDSTEFDNCLSGPVYDQFFKNSDRDFNLFGYAESVQSIGQLKEIDNSEYSNRTNSDYVKNLNSNNFGKDTFKVSNKIENCVTQDSTRKLGVTFSDQVKVRVVSDYDEPKKRKRKKCDDIIPNTVTNHNTPGSIIRKKYDYRNNSAMINSASLKGCSYGDFYERERKRVKR